MSWRLKKPIFLRKRFHVLWIELKHLAEVTATGETKAIDKVGGATQEAAWMAALCHTDELFSASRYTEKCHFAHDSSSDLKEERVWEQSETHGNYDVWFSNSSITLQQETEDPSFDEEAVKKERQELEEKLRDSINFCLLKAFDPKHLHDVAMALCRAKQVEETFQVSERCQTRIKELEDLRSKRAPIQRQIEALKQEQQSLQEKKKQLQPAQQVRQSMSLSYIV